MSTEVLPWGPAEYVQMPPIPADWNVLDLGPGAYPFKRANLFIDRDMSILLPLQKRGHKTLQADINRGLREISDKHFDYVWCSHVLEHVDDPAFCAATLSRIAKRGTIVMPSVYKDALFLFEERTHQWDVLANPQTGKPPIFVKRNRDIIYPLEDELASQALCFLFRTGSNHECTAERHLRAWYQVKEKNLDITYHWTDKLELIVIA